MKQRLNSIDSYKSLMNEEQENNENNENKENKDIRNIDIKEEDISLEDKNLGQYYFIGKDYSNIYKEDFKNLEEFSTGIFL